MIMCCFNITPLQTFHNSCFYTVIARIVWRQLLDIYDGASRVISVRNSLSVQFLILDSNEELGSIEGPKSLVDTSTKADANGHGVRSIRSINL
mmetsp:Transcript_11178/g.24198  ORF Transcript_11178/g.24198 Transcript_11178/m.24198 type:complete len:93 (-) Transcript_11178:40-318(-)